MIPIMTFIRYDKSHDWYHFQNLSLKKQRQDNDPETSINRRISRARRPNPRIEIEELAFQKII
jgi:hypothetical protein